MVFQGIKAVFLDIDNTLLDFNACSRLSMEKAFRECGLPFEADMYATFKTVNDGLWRQIEKNTITREQLHATRFNLVLEHLGLSGDGKAIETRFLEHLATDAIPIDGARELLTYLSGKHMLCIASNAPYEQQLKRLTGVDMLRYFDKYFISEKMGVAKPAKAYFDRCFAELPDLSPHETVMIGDSVTADIRGAADYGIHTCWYDHAKTGESCEKAECSVKTLWEIQKLL